ncbi:UDP-N-acetylmuramoyl-tripeptide--D-alanyl-D-alanine ligase [Anaerocolumna xylanovorans]|uniref:UDP-N-acetylmuramoyl-tripeptide--D-alanyl-D-alanine ligase n=1 Tax=Anaerocolumna xylanovorans DSM 12503 TaxID=1121345 RepID=A0A1M7YBP2_9FIRM|nr:UDP-N-acetylmuramoyl-tripeptide--D-alanyl-D-alanine ligase [Anaerocolumna xylanovorans]SHO49996.1 UDP-N-acetylmuramoyl-tripeptide--D-alanyl-D-alanine ligase [Anaerocolumna xylanovorans DSM 12503]
MEALTIKEIAQAVGGSILWGDENSRIEEVTTNSKKAAEGSLFVPIAGERVDGHDFIKDALAGGAAACLSQRKIEEVEGKACILVEDTLQALQKFGTCYREKFSIPVIGITGSVGKTTTKEMVAAALSAARNVLKTEGNMNSQVGLPLMMLKLLKEHEMGVIEMGMSEEGEMARLCNIAQPEAAIMTNIGISHIAQLKTRENIRKEKMNIINAFREGGCLVLNGDDDLLGEAACCLKSGEVNIDLSEVTREKFKSSQVITYGTGEDCDFKASDIRTVSEETTFTLTYPKDKDSLNLTPFHKENSLNEKSTLTEEVSLKVPGLHNVYNALAALAVAWFYQIPVSTAKEGLREYRPIAMRGQITVVHGIKIIDDSYNASPDSMKSGIRVLKELENVRRHIAVLADVKELGEISKQSHYEVGQFIAGEGIACVVTIGEEAYYIAKAIKDSGVSTETHSFTNNQEATAFLQSYLKSGDGVLIKGSRGMKTDEIVKELTKD